MKVQVTGRNVKVTKGLRDYVLKKMERLTRYDDRILSAHFILGVDADNHVAEGTLDFNGFIVHAEESSADMYSSIDLLFDILERQIAKHRDRIKDRKHRQGRTLPVQSRIYRVETGEPVREKPFELKPLYPEEAVLQLDMIVGKPALFYLDAATEALACVMKQGRKFKIVEFVPVEKKPWLAVFIKRKGEFFPSKKAEHTKGIEVKISKRFKPYFVPYMTEAEAVKLADKKGVLLFLEDDSPKVAYKRKNGTVGVMSVS